MAQTRIRFDQLSEGYTVRDVTRPGYVYYSPPEKEFNKQMPSWFVKPVLDWNDKREELGIEEEIITKYKVFDLDNSELGIVDSEEEGVELFLSQHPIFDRDAAKTFIYLWARYQP